MTATDVKNDIKILFFIINSINALLPGILLFSLGVTCAMQPVKVFQDSVVTTVFIVVGLITLAVAALGYAGAIRQNRIMLFIYAGLMVLGIVIEIVATALSDARDINKTFSLLTHICLAALGGSLSMVLALKSRNQSNQGMILSPPPAAYTPAAYTPVA